jgi:hypothetical protein
MHNAVSPGPTSSPIPLWRAADSTANRSSSGPIGAREQRLEDRRAALANRSLSGQRSTTRRITVVLAPSGSDPALAKEVALTLHSSCQRRRACSRSDLVGRPSPHRMARAEVSP